MIAKKRLLIQGAVLLSIAAALLGGCASMYDTAESSAPESSADVATVSSSDSESDRSGGDSVTNESNSSFSPAIVSVEIGEERFTIDLADNGTASAFAQLLPLEVNMSELNGNEKYIYLNDVLPSQPTNPGTIEAGDVMLYGDNCLVVFYKSHSTSYAYTRIGKINDTASLAEAVGSGSIKMSFNI